MNNIEKITKENINILTEEYCQNIFNKYKEVALIFISKELYVSNNKELLDTIVLLELDKKIKYTLLVISEDEDMEKSILKIYPDFTIYPTVIITDNTEPKELLEGELFFLKN